MSRVHSRSSAVSRRAVGLDGPIRLDLTVNPYGPSINVYDALASSDDLHLPAGLRETRLHLRLSHMVGVPPDWLLLTNGIDELLRMVCLWRQQCGPLVLFPPSDPADTHRAALHRLEVVLVQRTSGFALDLATEMGAELPRAAWALVGSPNDPTGTIVSRQHIVRLSRACELVVVDERHGEYSGRSLLPLVGEFDNIVVARTMETWAGLAGLPLAYAIGPPAILRQLSEFGRTRGISTATVTAASATLDDLAYVNATVQRVRAERSRMYRTLRKLNNVQPIPSWANFLLVRVERGERDEVARALARRRIQVHPPQHPELRQMLRISASRGDHTDALKQALIEIGLDTR